MHGSPPSAPMVPKLDMKFVKSPEQKFSSDFMEVSSATDGASISASSSGGGVNLLQVALSSLSLTDKVALSRSLQSIQAPSAAGTGGARSPRADSAQAAPSAAQDDLDSILESQSVWSESDKESLDVAMSLMGPQELARVEEEVKLIQNNVRAWLLRKNYTNLREAARVLQNAWRDKRQSDRLATVRHSVAEGGRESSPSRERTKKRRTSERSPERNLDDSSPRVVDVSNNVSSSGGSSFSDESARLSGQYPRFQASDPAKLSSAAATLQAMTRGMLARKSFENAKKQAMASLVIQKSLLSWWTQNKYDVGTGASGSENET
jgi:hypothetical protein